MCVIYIVSLNGHSALDFLYQVMSTSNKRPGEALSHSPKIHKNDSQLLLSNPDHPVEVAAMEAQPNSPHSSSNESDSSNVEVQYVATAVDDVFLATAAPSPRAAKDAFGDWKEPIIMLITKDTRDAFLDFLGKLRPNKTGLSGQKQTDKPTTEPVTNDTVTVPTEILTYDLDTGKTLFETYKDHIRSLNEIQRPSLNKL